MGEFYFKTSGRRIVGTLYGLFSLAASIALGIWALAGYKTSTTWWTVLLSVISVVALWYAVNRFISVFANKLEFYEKGLMIQTGFKKQTLMLSDVINVNIREQTGRNVAYSYSVIFQMTGGSVISLDHDDYAHFKRLMREYGEKVGMRLSM